MKVLVNGQIQQASFNSANELLNYLKTLQGQDLIIETISVNHHRIDGNWDDYIKMSFEQIELIEITHITDDEFTEQVVANLNDYLQQAQPQIEKLSDSFYLSPSPDEWNSLYNLLEGIQYIVTVIQTFTTHQKNPLQIVTLEYEQLLLTLKELTSAIEQQDSVRIADILLYEIKEQFEQLQKELQNFIMIEARAHDTN